MSLHDWALKWRVPLDCLQDLQRTLGLQCPPLPETHRDAGKSEGWVTSQVLLEASRKGVRLWRNNVGALQDKTGRWVRYGWANESEKLNKVLKSPDYCGWRKTLIQQQHFGMYFGVAVLREFKHEGWNYTGQGREPAQLAFLSMAAADGCDAAFCTGEGSL